MPVRKSDFLPEGDVSLLFLKCRRRVMTCRLPAEIFQPRFHQNGHSDLEIYGLVCKGCLV